MAEPARLNIWVVSDGRAGIEAQALGVAEAVARLAPADITVKRIAWRSWLRRLPTRLVPWPRLVLDRRRSDPLRPPWPDLWIANGRASAPLSIAVRRWSGRRTLVVQLQDPLRDPKLFDVVAPPAHDGLTGENVFPLLGAPNRMTPERLACALAEFPSFQNLPQPRLAVLVGGRSKAFDLPPERAERLADEIETALRRGGTLLMTYSRRTPAPARAILKARLAYLPGMIWDEETADAGPNPLLAMLAAADHVVVTADSINMTTEAAATGKPVHIAPLPGRQARKERFHAELERRGIARPFSSTLEAWTYEPLAETDRLAKHLIMLLRQRFARAAVG